MQVISVQALPAKRLPPPSICRSLAGKVNRNLNACRVSSSAPQAKRRAGEGPLLPDTLAAPPSPCLPVPRSRRYLLVLQARRTIRPAGRAGRTHRQQEQALQREEQGCVALQPASPSSQQVLRVAIFNMSLWFVVQEALSLRPFVAKNRKICKNR
jgi:hypothetical protein